MNYLQILFQWFSKLPCKLGHQGLWCMVNSISDAIYDYFRQKTFTTPDKFITVKRIIIMIKLCIFTPKCMNCFIQIFLSWSIIQSLDEIIHLIMMFPIWIIEYHLFNVRNFTWHPTSHRIISINMFIYFIPQL